MSKNSIRRGQAFAYQQALSSSTVNWGAKR